MPGIYWLKDVLLPLHSVRGKRMVELNGTYWARYWSSWRVTRDTNDAMKYRWNTRIVYQGFVANNNLGLLSARRVVSPMLESQLYLPLTGYNYEQIWLYVLYYFRCTLRVQLMYSVSPQNFHCGGLALATLGVVYASRASTSLRPYSTLFMLYLITAACLNVTCGIGHYLFQELLWEWFCGSSSSESSVALSRLLPPSVVPLAAPCATFMLPNYSLSDLTALISVESI